VLRVSDGEKFREDGDTYIFVVLSQDVHVSRLVQSFAAVSALPDRLCMGTRQDLYFFGLDLAPLHPSSGNYPSLKQA
jgi:hypothetical protein